MDKAPEVRFSGPTTRKKLERYREHEQDEATSVTKPKHNVGSMERSSGVRTRAMESQSPPTAEWCRCEDNLDLDVETRWNQADNEYRCLECGARKRTRSARSHTPIGDDSLPESVENSSQIASLTEEEEDVEDDENEIRFSKKRAAGSPKITGSPRLKPGLQVAKDDKSASWVYSAVALAILVVAFGACYALKFRLEAKESSLKRPGSSCKDFLQLHSKYPKTDDTLWYTLIVGVDRAINQDPGEPATFIFLYNSSNVSQNILDDVTRIAIGCFGSRGAIWRSSNDFKSAEIANDYENVLDRHREELKSQGILVVRDLDLVPPTAAKIFFTICDVYEPLVHKAIIFFTIDISRQPQQVIEQDRSATSMAEGILKDLWRGELQPNMLDPLVVRLTENVFRIH